MNHAYCSTYTSPLDLECDVPVVICSSLDGEVIIFFVQIRGSLPLLQHSETKVLTGHHAYAIQLYRSAYVGEF